MIISTVDNLLRGKNDVGWNKTKPAGVEGDHLLSVMKRFADIIAKSLEYHFHDRLVKTYEEADVIIAKENIGMQFMYTCSYSIFFLAPIYRLLLCKSFKFN